jgi:hypothetical protein
MTIWPMRSWRVSVASVLSTQRRCAELSCSPGANVFGDLRGWSDWMDGGATTLHAAVAAAMVSAKIVQIGGAVMLEYTSDAAFLIARASWRTPSRWEGGWENL